MHRRAFLLLVPGLGGCAGLTLRPSALDEAVAVRTLSLAFTPDGVGSLRLALDVDNPTAWDADVTGVDFSLKLEGRRYAVGTRGVRRALASRARQALEVSFPLRCEPTGSSTPARVWWVRVEGAVALAFGETVRRLPFRAERYPRLAHFRPLRLEPE
jgi:hypothetical protein